MVTLIGLTVRNAALGTHSMQSPDRRVVLVEFSLVDV